MRDPLLFDLADAVAANQDVDWDRCVRRAPPGHRRALDNLRAVARVFAALVPRPAGRATAAGRDSSAGSVARRALGVAVAVAVFEIVLTLALLPRAWDAYWREHGDLALFLLSHFVGHLASAVLLIVGGRYDRRARLLGIYFLLWTALPPAHMLPDFLWGPPPPGRLPDAIYLYPFAFAPAVLWAFAGEFPRCRRRTALDDATRRMTRVSVWMGAGLLVQFMVVLTLARGEVLDAAVFFVSWDVDFALLSLLDMAAVVVIALRARSAPPAEARRARLFVTAFVVWMGWVTAYDVVEVFWPGTWASNFRWDVLRMAGDTVRVAGVVTLWYAVLADRVLDLRTVVRATWRRLMVRRSIGLAAATPLVALGWRAGSDPDRSLSELAADPLVRILCAATLIAGLTFAFRERILVRLNAWVDPRRADHRNALAAATSALAQARDVPQVSSIVAAAVRRGCGAPADLLVAPAPSDPHAGYFAAPAAGGAPLARASAIVHVLEATRAPVPVHPDAAASAFAWLPWAEAQWVVAREATVLAPVTGPGADLAGVLVVGRRFDDGMVGADDFPFLEALGTAVGIAVDRLNLLRASALAGREQDAAPGRECPACGHVAETGDRCGCGAAYVEAPTPALLAGKFRMQRRLGVGGMGVVYLARDVSLERDVAVKTLDGTSAAGLVRLKQEARTLAAVTHPAIAGIHGVESWRGRPLLVVEFLPGGTLADRIRRNGRIRPAGAAGVAAATAGGLAALHDAGYLHGDVKPSNVGFAEDGSAKLLDFGLARLAAGERFLPGGTAAYLSPELLAGRPAAAADDVWALGVVLYEMVSGRHPFGGDADVTERIRRRRIHRARPPAAPGSTALLAFAESMLTADRPARPRTARAFAEALRGVSSG